MKRLVAVLVLGAVLVALRPMCFAATQYVIANANNRPDNALVVYTLDTESGSLTQIAVLATGGDAFGPEGPQNVSNVGQAVSRSANCIFVLDPGILPSPTDIAAFSKASGYAKVGNYSDASLQESDTNGSIALTPNGKFLYASTARQGTSARGQ